MVLAFHNQWLTLHDQWTGLPSHHTILWISSHNLYQALHSTWQDNFLHPFESNNQFANKERILKMAVLAPRLAGLDQNNNVLLPILDLCVGRAIKSRQNEGMTDCRYSSVIYSLKERRLAKRAWITGALLLRNPGFNPFLHACEFSFSNSNRKEACFTFYYTELVTLKSDTWHFSLFPFFFVILSLCNRPQQTGWILDYGYKYGRKKILALMCGIAWCQS